MLRRSCLLVALAVVASSCASPTLPLPPPERPETITFEGDDTVVLKGSAQPEAIVYAFNQDLESGAIGKASELGTYVLRIKAQVGNDVAIWQEVGIERSPSVVVTIRKP